MSEGQGQRAPRAPDREGTEERRQVSAWQGGQGLRHRCLWWRLETRCGRSAVIQHPDVEKKPRNEVTFLSSHH